jgi:hypothetical protein
LCFVRPWLESYVDDVNVLPFSAGGSGTQKVDCQDRRRISEFCIRVQGDHGGCCERVLPAAPVPDGRRPQFGSAQRRIELAFDCFEAALDFGALKTKIWFRTQRAATDACGAGNLGGRLTARGSSSYDRKTCKFILPRQDRNPDKIGRIILCQKSSRSGAGLPASPAPGARNFHPRDQRVYQQRDLDCRSSLQRGRWDRRV